MPGDWEQVVDDFLNFGRKNYGFFYSFSEQCGMHVQCEHGRSSRPGHPRSSMPKPANCCPGGQAEGAPHSSMCR
jgi:hypothetical protein